MTIHRTLNAFVNESNYNKTSKFIADVLKMKLNKVSFIINDETDIKVYNSNADMTNENGEVIVNIFTDRVITDGLVDIINILNDTANKNDLVFAVYNNDNPTTPEFIPNKSKELSKRKYKFSASICSKNNSKLGKLYHSVTEYSTDELIDEISEIINSDDVHKKDSKNGVEYRIQFNDIKYKKLKSLVTLWNKQEHVNTISVNKEQVNIVLKVPVVYSGLFNAKK